jgi:hypothetical protein
VIVVATEGVRELKMVIFCRTTTVVLLKTAIFGRQPRWFCSKWPFSAVNRGGFAQNDHFRSSTAVVLLKMTIFGRQPR